TTVLVRIRIGERLGNEHQPFRPTEAVLSTQFVTIAEHEGPLFDIRWNQGGTRSQPLSQVELFNPCRTRWFVVPGHDWGRGLRRPFFQGPVFSANFLSCPHIRDLLHIENAFERLAPRSWHPR